MASESSSSEKRFRLLRKQLDELGYLNSLPIDAIPLVERLTSDLLHTTESLRHFKEIAQKALEERSYFDHGFEPYKQENSKLVRECNDLHIKLLKTKEDAERQHKDLKTQIRKLQSENSDLKFLSSQHLQLVKELEKESAEKTLLILQLQNKTAPPVVITKGNKKQPLRPRATLEIDAPLDPPKSWKDQYWSATAQLKDPYIVNMVEKCDERICSLSREVNLLSEERSQLSEKVAVLENKIVNRDREIERLQCMLEGGRPLAAVAQDFKAKEMDIQLQMCKDEVKRLENENKELQATLKETVASQHEAMTRAFRLAERNKLLETEIRDIDRIALTVEAECNSTVKERNNKIHKIQEKLDKSLIRIKELEVEVLELKRNNQEQQADLEKVRLERQKLRKLLDTNREEKKKISDKVNKYTIIEKDLMSEIDRLTQINSLQNRKNVELENQILQFKKNESPAKAKKTSSNGTLEIQIQQLRAERDHFKREFHIVQQQLQKVSGLADPAGGGDGTNTFQRIQSERDQYKKEVEKLEEKIRSMNEQMNEKMKDSEGEAENNMLLHRRLSEADQEIENLQMRLQNLSLEKQHLQNIIDTQIVSCVTRSCGTSPILDPAHGASLKVATEIQVTEHARLEKTIMDSEDRVRRLEMERRELMSAAGVQNATINKLEEELGAYRDKYQSVVNELTQQRSLYTQIQSLQEQTDLALANSQGQISQLETELSNAQERIRNLEGDRASLDKEISSLRSEHSVLRGSLAKVDQEKDMLLLSIDSKTEEVVRLEQRSKMSDKKILDLEGTVVELRKKLECSMDELATQEEVARSAEREAKELRMEFTALERTRDGLVRENRRLQDELSTATKDVRQANANLHSAREEVETLKRQLQEYVAEIRRVEELLAAKENERSEMLEHFRGLTVEATMLETNNHSLESEAQETKHQLSMANERIQDLEQQLDIRDNLVQSYESQIQELTTSIAKLETQLQQFMGNRQKADNDLEELRALCMKLDSQKDALQQQINQQDLMKMQLESEMSQLQERQAHMEEHLGRDSANIASLESMLASSRSETVAQRRANEELKGEVKQLQQKVDCLQAKLESESAELERYQYQANEYRRQIKDLQREITNERFEKARATDESKSYSTTL